jgi:hypothetical protein
MLEKLCWLKYADIVLVSSQENKYLGEVSGYGTTHTPKIPKVDAHKSLICLLYPFYIVFIDTGISGIDG